MTIVRGYTNARTAILRRERSAARALPPARRSRDDAWRWKAAFAVLAVLTALFLWSPRARAATLSDVSVGVVLGEPIGGTAKLWFDDRFAADAGVGLSEGNAALWGDALWHDWSLFPQPTFGRLGGYLGTGLQVRTGDDARFGVRAIGGLVLRPKDSPLELFAEVGPLFRLTQGGVVDVVGGVGVRARLGKAAR